MNNKPTFFNKDMAKRLAKKTAIGGAIGYAGGGGAKFALKKPIDKLVGKYQQKALDASNKYWGERMSSGDNLFQKLYGGETELGDEEIYKAVNDHHKHWDEKEKQEVDPHFKNLYRAAGLREAPTGRIGAGIGLAKGLYDEVKRYRKEKKDHEEMNKQASDIKWANFETFKPQTLKLETFKPQTLKLEIFKPQTGEWTKNNNSTKSSSPKDEGLSKNQKIGLGIGGVALTLYGAHRLRKYLKNRKEQKRQEEMQRGAGRNEQ